MDHTARNGLVCFVAGMISVAGLLMLHHHIVPSLHAQGDPAKGGSTWQAAGTGVANKQDNGCIWIYDASEQSISCYINDGSRAIRHIGTRKCTYDFKLKEANDLSKLSAEDLKKEWEKTQKETNNQ